MKEKYLLIPELVRSRTDGDLHFVDAGRLSWLYGVRREECLVMPPQRPENHRRRMDLLERVRLGDLVALCPRADGDYRLPEARP